MEASQTASDTVQELIELQELDEEIGRDASELEQLESELRAMEEKEQELDDRVEAVRRDLTGAVERLRRQERTVQAARATFKALQQRANDVQNMRQHLAARAEVDAARRNLDSAEDGALDGMQETERLRAALAEAESALESAASEHGGRRAEIEERREELEGRLAVHRDRRSNRALRIDDQTRRLYDTVRGGRTREALAPIVDGVCGHCFTAIPLQRQAEVRAGRALVVCETCGVILHAPRDDGDDD